MQLHRLRYFVAVAETGSFTRAAQREGISQPSLSQQILELESELNTRLFDRLGRRIVLTAKGQLLLPAAQNVLAAVADAERAMRAGSFDTELRVGMIPTVAPYLLPGVTRRFILAHPEVRLHFLEERTERLLEEILTGKLDLAVMALPIRDDRLHVERLRTEPLLAALPRGHRLAKKSSIRLADLADEPFLLLDELHCFGEQVLSLCRRGGKFEPRVVCRGEQLGTLLGLVAAGIGISVVPQMATLEEDRQRVYIPLSAPSPTRTLAAIWHKQRYRPPAVRDFLTILKSRE